MASNNGLSQETGHKYTFQLELKKLYISPSLPFQVKVVWARGQNRIQSQNPIKLQPPQNEIVLQQCFCNKSTVLFNPKKYQFRKKQSRIQVILYANGSPKQGGEFVLNLCQILDPFNIKKQQQKTYRVITRQQKPRCEIQFKLTAQYCQQMVRDEQRSIGSGVGSMNSKNTTSMGYPNPTATTTNIIGGYDANKQQPYVQKKNLFLYQAPSKDNQSITSYNSYSTSMMRYQSGSKKQQRPDSMRKEEYGMATTNRLTINNSTAEMFSKTTGVNIKAVTQQQQPIQFDGKSRTAYSRITQQQQQQQAVGSQQYDNKTESFDNPSTKQLQDQQAKRSKLQAQVSRLNIYVKQQSNKLTEYIQQNTRLKQQLNRISSQQTSRSSSMQKQTTIIKQQLQQQLQSLRRQNQQLHRGGFDITNQNRQIKLRLDELLRQRQRLDEQLRQYKNEKERAQTRFESLNRNMEGIISNKEMSSMQLQSLRDELQHIKSVNTNLRDMLEKQRRKTQQLQMSSNYQHSTVQQTLKKKQQRVFQLQRQNSALMVQFRDRQNQLQTKKQLLYRLQKTSNQYKQRILMSDSEKSKLLLENVSLRNQYEKVKSQCERVKSQHARAKQDSYNFSGVTETMRKQLQDKKNEICRLQANVKGLKQIQNKFYNLDKLQTQRDKQIIVLRQQNSRLSLRVNELEDQYRRITTQNDQLRKKSISIPDVDVNQILRQSVQMQVQLKFKTDQLIRLKNIQQKFNQIIYRLQMQQRIRKQSEQQIERLQRQVKQKNKLYLIEVEKGKMILNEKSLLEREFDGLRMELKRCQEIIYNGDKQVKQLEGHVKYLQGENNQMGRKLVQAEEQLAQLMVKVDESARLEERIKHLSQEATSASQKLIKMQGSHSTISSQLHRAVTQKKSLQLKCDTIMQQLHYLKKQYQDQKVRSTSVVSIRSNQDQVRIRQMQHQLEKKDKMISKLTKQKLQIEEENINLHVQVMKKLSEMEKNKDINVV